MPSQGVATLTPPFIREFLNDNDGIPEPAQAFSPSFPEFFDEAGWPALWPHSLRSIQNAEGSLVDAFVRTIFGFRPSWPTKKNCYSNKRDALKAVESSLFLKDVPRNGFNGTLKNILTPFIYSEDCKTRLSIDIHADSQGLTWSPSAL